MLVIGISFAVITLISSTYRFHRMLQLSEEALTTVEDCNDFFFVQVTRYLSKINRVSSGFGVFVVQFVAETPDKRRVQEEMLGVLKKIVRDAHDKVCLFRDDCVAAIIDTDESTVPEMAQRITLDLKKNIGSVPSVKTFRAGVSSFPAHGLSTQQIIDTATQALETGSFENQLPFCLAPWPADNENRKPEGEAVALAHEDKRSAIDSLTGVLSSAAVGSYMRKYLADIRQRKQSATLLCVGINRIDQIIKL
ncbi:MAG TPA: hypothetical protein PLD51_00190, partial [Pontiellaceae bacterium]|nr:hypothetical protein [Pontiellaceae bacterium]